MSDPHKAFLHGAADRALDGTRGLHAAIVIVAGADGTFALVSHHSEGAVATQRLLRAALEQVDRTVARARTKKPRPGHLRLVPGDEK